jgi:hypothetical protein
VEEVRARSVGQRDRRWHHIREVARAVEARPHGHPRRRRRGRLLLRGRRRARRGGVVASVGGGGGGVVVVVAALALELAGERREPLGRVVGLLLLEELSPPPRRRSARGTVERTRGRAHTSRPMSGCDDGSRAELPLALPCIRSLDPQQ